MSDDEPRAPAGPAAYPAIDLTLGAWRPWEAATQLAAALGVALPDAPLMPASPLDEIDAGAVGEATVFHAHAVAGLLSAALPQNGIVAILTPRFGLPLRRDNEWLFLFLKRRSISLAIVGDEPVTTVIGRSLFERRAGVVAPAPGERLLPLTAEQERLLRFFPGLLPRSLVGAIPIDDTGLVAVGADRFLIPPAWRDDDPRTAAPEIDAMAAIETSDEGFAAFAECHCTAHFADGARLCDLSRRLETAGALEIAADLAERARQVARDPAERAAADIRRQKVRLRLGRFDDMLAMPPPSRRAPEPDRECLARLKLRAALAAGRSAELDADLGPLAGRLAGGEPLAADDLLLVDTHAAVLATDAADRALTLAETVRDALDRQPDADRRLVHRNAMTLARIHEAQGDRDRRRAALDRAFATTHGLRRLGEIVAMNILRATAEAEPTAPAEQGAWLRAALAWLAFVPPEAAPPGIVDLLFGAGVDTVRARLDIDISEALADRMTAAWPGLTASVGGEYPAIRAASALAPPQRLVGGPGAVIGWSASDDATPVYVRPRVRLVRLVEAALATLCPALPGLARGVFLVEDNAGVDIPATRDEALSVALRSRLPELVFGAETISLDPESRMKHVTGIVPRLAPTLSVVDGSDGKAVCRFGRHRPDVTVEGVRAELVLRLRDEPAMSLGPLRVVHGKTVTETEMLYRDLELLGVVRLDVRTAEAAVSQEATEPPPPEPKEEA